MATYIFALVIGILIFLWQNFKPTSNGFRLLFLILTVAFLWGMYYTHLGSWLFVIIPLGEFLLAFICALIFPYGSTSAIAELNSLLIDKNFYKELSAFDKIGKYQVSGFKQTYDRIIGGLLSSIVISEEELHAIGNVLYSKNFYPISEATKQQVLNHIEESLRTVPRISNSNSHKRILEPLFNAYVAVMSIHEEATDTINRLKAESE